MGRLLCLGTGDEGSPPKKVARGASWALQFGAEEPDEGSPNMASTALRKRLFEAKADRLAADADIDVTSQFSDQSLSA